MADAEVDKEVLDRVRRIETKQMRMAELLGLDLKLEESTVTLGQNNSVHLTDLNVTLSGLIRKARYLGLHGRLVAVFYEGKYMCEIEA